MTNLSGTNLNNGAAVGPKGEGMDSPSTKVSGANLNNGTAVGPQGEGRDSPSSFPTYPAYKDSGVEWLGVVPEHWVVTRLGRVTEIESGYPFPAEQFVDDGIPVVRMSDLKEGQVSLDSIKRVEARFVPVKAMAKADDLLIGLSGSISNFAQVSASDLPLAVNQRVGIIRADDSIEATIAKYFVISKSFICQIESAVPETTILNISMEQVRSCALAWPPRFEQTQIARFLDHETARIDALIEEQQRLIELLKEKRQAVISHAVTKGLDPTVPMKDSGVEWLGKVPAHWGTNALNKLTVKITNGYVGPTRDILVESGVPYVQATHIKRGVVNFDDAYFVTPEWSMRMSKSILQEGDVLIVQTGAGTGDVGVVSSKEVGYNCHALIILQTDKNILSGVFLGQVLQSRFGQSVLYSIRTGGMHPHLNCGEVKFVKIPVPPLREQEEISNFVKTFSEQAEKLIIEAGTTMDLLQERRSALISAAVTGKIDVRGWQPPASTQAPKFEVAEAD